MTVGRFEEGKRLDLALEFSARSGIRGVVTGAMEGKSYLTADMGFFVRCSLEVKAKSNNCWNLEELIFKLGAIHPRP